MMTVVIDVSGFCSKCPGLHYETVIWAGFYNKTSWSWQDDSLTPPLPAWTFLEHNPTLVTQCLTVMEIWVFQTPGLDISYFIQILSFVSFSVFLTSCWCWIFVNNLPLHINLRYWELQCWLLDEIFHHQCFSLTPVFLSDWGEREKKINNLPSCGSNCDHGTQVESQH